MPVPGGLGGRGRRRQRHGGLRQVHARGAQISVNSDLAGSLFADIEKSRGGGADEEPPVARIHPKGIKAASEEFTNYKERDAKVCKSKSLGEGRKAIFVADGSFGAKVYGYRATFLSNDKRITVLCQCPAADWKTLRPAFDTVIESLGR